MLAAVITFLHAYGPWIVGSLLPSLIVGLTKSPQTDGVAKFLMKVMNLLSVLTHRDEPGTLKIPVLTSAASARVTARFSNGVNHGPSGVVLLVLVCSIMACPKPTPAPGPGPRPADASVGSILINCAEDAVKQSSTTLLPAVATALATDNWESELLTLVLRFGETAIDCAVAQLTGEAENDVRMARSDGIAEIRASHGRLWLAKRSVTTSGAGL